MTKKQLIKALEKLGACESGLRSVRSARSRTFRQIFQKYKWPLDLRWLVWHLEDLEPALRALFLKLNEWLFRAAPRPTPSPAEFRLMEKALRRVLNDANP